MKGILKSLKLGINRRPACENVGSARRNSRYTIPRNASQKGSLVIPAYFVEKRDRTTFLKTALRKEGTPKVETLISYSINASDFNGISCIEEFAMSAGCPTSEMDT